MIVKLESEGWPYEELRGRAPLNLPDGYDGYNTLNAFFAVALLGILIPMALQRCVYSSCCQPQVKSELTYTSLDNHLARYPSYFVAKLLQKASKKRQLDTELLTGYTGITVMMLTLTLTLTQTLTLYDNPTILLSKTFIITQHFQISSSTQHHFQPYVTHLTRTNPR